MFERVLNIPQYTTMPKKRCETNFAKKKKKEILENEIFQEKSFLFPTHITYRSFSNELKITVNSQNTYCIPNTIKHNRKVNLSKYLLVQTAFQKSS